LRQALAECAQVTRTHSKSFYFATAFLPAEKRAAVRALYAFCRTSDDLVDMSSSDERAARLDRWRHEARLPAASQQHPALLAFAWARERYDIPHQYADELLDGCAMDLRIARYETWDDLRKYCYLVASTVGLMSMHIIGACDGTTKTLEEAKTFAIDLGVALQLTNILRDVGDDLRRGRVYLPQEDMHRFGYTEHDLHGFVIDERFKKLMRFEMDRADVLYDSSWRGIGMLSADGRMAVGSASLLYRSILGQIHANSYDVFTKRAHLSTSQKLSRMPQIMMRVAQF
jgi:phytoene synthase